MVDKENKFSADWPQNNIRECINKFQNFRECVQTRKEKYGYSGCIALSQIYNGDFLSEDPLNEFLKK